MRIVVFGLSLSSSWGNGHAAVYRALLEAIAARRHEIHFLERSQPSFARHRDIKEPTFCRLKFYDRLGDLAGHARLVAGADIVVVGSRVPDGVELARWVQQTATGLTVFYDIDTPDTMARLRAGDCDYMSSALIPRFDLYLSFTGGPALRFLEEVHGASAARVLHCCVDEGRYRAVPAARRWHLGFLGAHVTARQAALERLLIEPARRAPDLRFVVAGPHYPADLEWPANVERIDYLPPTSHPQFYSSLCWALNVTRPDLLAIGNSPSVRLFEAAACGAPIITDQWAGLDQFFLPAAELVVARASDEVLAALRWPEEDRLRLADAGRRRILAQHTAGRRAEEFEAHIDALSHRQSRIRRRPVAEHIATTARAPHA